MENKQLFPNSFLSYRLKSGNKLSKKIIKTTDIVVGLKQRLKKSPLFDQINF